MDVSRPQSYHTFLFHFGLIYYKVALFTCFKSEFLSQSSSEKWFQNIKSLLEFVMKLRGEAQAILSLSHSILKRTARGYGDVHGNRVGMRVWMGGEERREGKKRQRQTQRETQRILYYSVFFQCSSQLRQPSLLPTTEPQFLNNMRNWLEAPVFEVWTWLFQVTKSERVISERESYIESFKEFWHKLRSLWEQNQANETRRCL